MALQEAAIKAVLTGDATFAGYATGGIKISPEDFANNDGATLENLDAASAFYANGKLKPTAVITFGADAKSNLQLGERRFFQVWCYEDSGFANIRLMKRRIKTLLDRQTIDSANETSNYIEYVDAGPEFIDENLLNKSASWCRLFVLYLRSS